jgi:hypothetical protein
MTMRAIASLCLTVSVVIASMGCSSSTNPDRITATAPAPSASRQVLDAQVIEAALVDLVGASDKESRSLRLEQGEGRALLSKRILPLTDLLRQELSRAETESWSSLRSTDREAAKMAAADIVHRLENNESVVPFRPKDPRIRVSEDDSASSLPLGLGKPRPIYTAPPGYNDNHRLSVVVFSFSWSIHGGDVSYVLRFDGSKWNVIARHFAYYL